MLTLTVSEALKLKPLESARVVAGQAGLDRVVSWVHNAGVPDAPDWLNGGELVLTTIINMPESPEERVRYIHAMAEKGVAGLIITVGKYIQQLPDYLLTAADACDFPLMEIPFVARFVDIGKSINALIANRNIEMTERALKIQQTLTQLVLEGGGFKQLAVKLAEMVRHSISIENERFDAIASENIAPVDEARRYTLLHGRTNPLLIEALEDDGFLPRIRQTLRPQALPKMPQVGLEMERILAPIVVHGQIYGYLWIIADDHALSEIDMMAIQSASTIAALMMLYQESVQSAEASLKGSLLSQLIQGEPSREAILTDQSLRYGVDLRAPFVAILVEMSEVNGQPLTLLYRRINQFLSTGMWHTVAGQFAGQIVLLVQAANPRQLAEKILEQNPSQSIRIGISGVHRGAETVPAAHRQCIEVLHITRRLKTTERIVFFEQMGYLHTLYHAGPASLNSNAYVPALRLLMEEKQADLFHTLEAYLDAGGNGIQTAELLHIHRSTLNYRLARIEDICQLDLSDPAARINLQVALKLMRLFEVD